jgi:hypothetical protein
MRRHAVSPLPLPVPESTDRVVSSALHNCRRWQHERLPLDVTISLGATLNRPPIDHVLRLCELLVERVALDTDWVRENMRLRVLPHQIGLGLSKATLWAKTPRQTI